MINAPVIAGTGESLWYHAPAIINIALKVRHVCVVLLLHVLFSNIDGIYGGYYNCCFWFR